ncbi:MAG: ExeA family protein, partial [Longimicrobiales bacterium]
MYERFFGLRERPFDLTPNPRFLLLTPTHREALANLEYGLRAQKGLTLLIGEAGTGKTTLVRRALASRIDAGGGNCVYLNNPTLTHREFYEFLAEQFGLPEGTVSSKAQFLLAIERELRRRQERGEQSVLVIDEAQSLPDELLEEVRLLANIETDTTKLLPLILAGQPELATRLNQIGLRQLKQRVALRCQLAPLTLAETAAYIAGRIQLAGGDASTMLSRDAVIAVHDYSHGIPRTISVLCDNALLTAFATGERPVTEKTVRGVARDFDVAAAPPRPSAAPAKAGQEDGAAGRTGAKRKIVPMFDAPSVWPRA